MLSNRPAGDETTNDELPVCTLEDLRSQPSQMLRVMLRDTPVAVCYVNGEVWAVQDKCTHGAASLSEGYLEDGTLECPMHGGIFDIRTGQPVCLPASVKLQRFAVSIRENTVHLSEA